MLLSLAIVTPMGPYIHRIAFRPLAEASTLVLLIAAVGVHLTLTGFGLVFFGAEGSRTTSFSNGSFALGPVTVSGQSLFVLGASIALALALYLVFELSLIGKALKGDGREPARRAARRHRARLCAGASPSASPPSSARFRAF